MARVYRDKLKIGTYIGKELLIDFDDLFKYKGSRKFWNNFQKRLGFFLIILGLVLVFLPLLVLDSFNLKLVLVDILNPPSALYVFPFFSVYLVMYGFYLRRPKDEFRDGFENLNLRHLINKLESTNIKKIEIENYFTEEILGLIDYAFYKDANTFIFEFSKLLLTESNMDLLTKRLGISAKDFEARLTRYFNSIDSGFDKNHQEFFLTAFSNGIRTNVEQIDSFVMLGTMMQSFWKEVLFDLSITTIEIQGFTNWIANLKMKQEYKKRWEVFSKLKPIGAVNRSFTTRVTPTIDQYGKDLTALAARGKFVVSLGKEAPLNSLIQNLQKNSSAAIILIGEPGVGKTYLLEHLATRMVIEDVPDELKDSRLILIDLNRILAKSQTVDKFKQVLQDIFDEVTKSGKIILILEEIGQLFSMRSEGRQEVVNLITNAVDDQNLKIIATTTLTEYQQRIKPINSFASLFEVVTIPEPDSATSFQILMDIVPSLEKKYGVTVKSGSVKKIVNFSPTIFYEKHMPDKAIDFLEEAIIAARSQNRKELDEFFVDDILKDKTGVNVGNISTEEARTLSNLETILQEKIIGQTRAVQAIGAALRRARSGLVSGKRPLASFLFYGPTGVGKTYIAKILAEMYYGDKKLMTRINMSEYNEEKNIARLLGEVKEDGYFEGGFLTEPVRSMPYSLVLVDEIEKANPKVLDLFLQILDEGYIEDGLGRKIDFTHTMVIATSNAGSKRIADLVEQGMSYQYIEPQVKDELRSVFKVEFLNRFDKVIMFRSLTKLEIQKIAHLLLTELHKKLSNEKNIRIQWDAETLEKVAEIGYNPIYGARELRRAIQESVENELANVMISGKLRSGGEAYFKGLKINEIFQ